MKKVLIIFLFLMACCITSYFLLDKKLFYYGKNDFNFYKPLPLNIKPVFSYDYDIEDPFYLEDQHGFSLISKGEARYFGTNITFTVKEILEYGFNDEKVIALVEDIAGKKYYIECIKNPDKHAKQDMNIKVFDGNTQINPSEYKWIEIKDSNDEKLELIRNYLIIIFIAFIFILIYLTYKIRNAAR